MIYIINIFFHEQIKKHYYIIKLNKWRMSDTNNSKHYHSNLYLQKNDCKHFKFNFFVAFLLKPAKIKDYKLWKNNLSKWWMVLNLFMNTNNYVGLSIWIFLLF